MNSLQDKVNSALDIAVFENLYVELMGWSAYEVAVDLCTYAPELEVEEVEDVEVCVRDYQTWYQSEENTTRMPKARRIAV